MDTVQLGNISDQISWAKRGETCLFGRVTQNENRVLWSSAERLAVAARAIRARVS